MRCGPHAHHQPFEDIASLDDKLAFLRRQLRGRVHLGGDAPKWAWVEHRLAQGGFAEGLAAAHAARAGGGFGGLEAGTRIVDRRRRVVSAPDVMDYLWACA